MVYPGDLLEHLRSFVAIAAALDQGERGAFARAAGELAVDVSVLRRRLHTLAAESKASLFDGRGSTLRLSRAGVRVRSNALRALEAADAILVKGGPDEGPLRVACTGTILAEVLPPILRTMRGKYPSLGFRVRRAGAAAARQLLTRGDVDFIVTRGSSRPDGFACARIGGDRLFLVTCAGSPLARARRPSLTAIARAPLVGYASSSTTMQRVLAVLGPLGAAPWIEVDGKAAAMSYVAADLGIAFVSALEPQIPSRRGVHVRDVSSAFAPTSFWLAWNAATLDQPWGKQFADLVTTRRGG